MIDINVQGIPCQAEVVSISYTEPDYGTWASDWDYYGGWYNIEYDVLDRKGYPARWLENKMTDEDHNRILSEIEEHLDPEDW